MPARGALALHSARRSTHPGVTTTRRCSKQNPHTTMCKTIPPALAKHATKLRQHNTAQPTLTMPLRRVYSHRITSTVIPAAYLQFSYTNLTHVDEQSRCAAWKASGLPRVDEQQARWLSECACKATTANTRRVQTNHDTRNAEQQPANLLG